MNIMEVNEQRAEYIKALLERYKDEAMKRFRQTSLLHNGCFSIKKDENISYDIRNNEFSIIVSQRVLINGMNMGTDILLITNGDQFREFFNMIDQWCK